MAETRKLVWTPDLSLPAGKGASLQEFTSHAEGAELRVLVHNHQQAEVEVNGHIVAETTGFDNAALLAERYLGRQKMLCMHPNGQSFYAIRPTADGYVVEVGESIIDLARLSQTARRPPTTATLAEALNVATTDAGGRLLPAFLDQRELHHNLAEDSPAGLMVAIWASRWQLGFTDIFSNAPVMLASFAVARSSDGAFYTIYRLTDGKFLTEMRSRHRAEKIAEFDTADAARAYATVHNAARRAQAWQRLYEGPASSTTPYTIEPAAHGHLLLHTNDDELIGRFPSHVVAEAYATVYHDALTHFSEIAKT